MMIVDAPSFWAFLPQSWIILGVILIILEVFDGNLIAFSFGVSALIQAFLLWADESALWGDYVLIESTRELLYAYASTSILSILLIRLVFQSWKKKNPKDGSDVNIY